MGRVEDIEILRRSIAMLPPCGPGLDREEAMAILAELVAISRELEHLKRGLRELLADA